jgi:flagellar basal body-associated protein FliL
MTQHQQQVRSTETKAKQGGAPRVTLWILLVSILLAAIVGFMLLSNTDEYPPSAQRNNVENNPVSGNQPTPPVTQPQTKQ